VNRPQRRILCLGDPLVDLICEQPVDDLRQVGAFVPHLGGVVANVAVVAARIGTPVQLAGGAGADAWGEWLRARLEQEPVELSAFSLVPGERTPFAFVTVSSEGEAAYALHGGDGALRGIEVAALRAAVAGAAGLFLSSNTLAAEPERAVTMAAREQALDLGRPIVFDANLRLHRWRSRADAAASANACVPDATLVRVNQEEAALLTGEQDVERAATALVKAGARAVVVSLVAEGAILRGSLRVDGEAEAVVVRSTLGAGDVLTGTLLAKLVLSDFYLPAVAAGLGEAGAQATAACQRWCALE